MVLSFKTSNIFFLHRAENEEEDMECDFDFDGVDFDEEMTSQESEEPIAVRNHNTVYLSCGH